MNAPGYVHEHSGDFPGLLQEFSGYPPGGLAAPAAQ